MDRYRADAGSEGVPSIRFEAHVGRYPAHSNLGPSRITDVMAPSASAPDLSAETLYDALANDRRRASLRYIDEGEGWVSVRTLASDIAPLTADSATVAEESVYISLIQVHMPKLATYGVVEYDEEEKLVRPGPAFAQTMDCLQYHKSTDDGTALRDKLLPFLTASGLLLALVAPTIRWPLLVGVGALQVGIVVLERERLLRALDGGYRPVLDRFLQRE